MGRGPADRRVAYRLVTGVAIGSVLSLGLTRSTTGRGALPDPATVSSDDVRAALLKAALGTETGSSLLAELQVRYRAGFERLRHATRISAARLVVVYVPPVGDSVARASHRDWFAEICREYGVPFVDAAAMTDELASDLRARDADHGFDAALCERFAAALAPRLTPFLPDSPLPSSRPDVEPYGLLGDEPGTPHGLRDHRPMCRPKLLHHVLVLGDALAACPALAFESGWPNRLERHSIRTRFCNAALRHATIDDQAALFAERARHADADLVLLQVGDDDLADLLAIARNRHARDRLTVSYAPSARERRLMESIDAAASSPPR